MPGGLMTFAPVAADPAIAGSFEQYTTGAPSPATTGWYWTPRVRGGGDYPFDFDGSERYMRPRRGWDRVPDPYMQMRADGGATAMSWIPDLYTRRDDFTIAAFVGRPPWGPVIGIDPVGDVMLSPVWGAEGLMSPMDFEEVTLNIPRQLGG